MRSDNLVNLKKWQAREFGDRRPTTGGSGREAHWEVLLNARPVKLVILSFCASKWCLFMPHLCFFGPLGSNYVLEMLGKIKNEPRILQPLGNGYGLIVYFFFVEFICCCINASWIFLNQVQKMLSFSFSIKNLSKLVNFCWLFYPKRIEEIQ